MYKLRFRSLTEFKLFITEIDYLTKGDWGLKLNGKVSIFRYENGKKIVSNKEKVRLAIVIDRSKDFVGYDVPSVFSDYNLYISNLLVECSPFYFIDDIDEIYVTSIRTHGEPLRLKEFEDEQRFKLSTFIRWISKVHNCTNVLFKMTKGQKYIYAKFLDNALVIEKSMGERLDLSIARIEQMDKLFKGYTLKSVAYGETMLPLVNHIASLEEITGDLIDMSIKTL